MDDAQENDNYEERLKEVFNSFNTSGTGSLCPEELSELCQSLHLDDATPALLHALLQNQDPLTARVDFEQFKNALILVLSATIESSQTEQETLPKPETSEIQPKFVKGRKHYGRRSTPEFIEPISDFSEVTHAKLTEDEDQQEDNDDSAVPRKRERWNGRDTSSEEFEAEGQMQLWNPDEPSTPRGSIVPLSDRLEERLYVACDELGIVWDGCASHTELLALCEHLNLEIKRDLLQSLSDSGVMNVQEFVSRLVNHNKPPTPSASTPYRQLKRHHSMQPFDEGGRRITIPAAMTSTIGLRLFSTLDDGTGYTPVEYILDAWMEEGIENSTEILQALNFNISGKVSLGDLTMALENELLVTKNGIHQAALVSFKAEIRHLLERVDRELGEKEKIRSDLEKAEKLKTQLATEVDEHHSAIEQMNNLNIRKLEQDHKEKLTAIRAELMKEMDQIQQQAGLRHEELEAEIKKIKEDESFLRDHLSISVKENRRLEMELLDGTEKLLEAQNQIEKLQSTLDSIMKEKFGDLDPSSADFFLQEDRIKQLRSSYEAQCRELKDRIDELQSELQDFQGLGQSHQPCHKPLSEELESQSPGMESDQGIGSEEVQPFSMSLEVEMMLEQLKEQHLQEKEELQRRLETKINEFDESLEKQREAHEGQTVALTLKHKQEVQSLREEMATFQSHAQALQTQLKQTDLERATLVLKQAEEKEELKKLQENELESLKQQLLETNTYIADLEQQLKTFEVQEIETAKNHVCEMEKLREEHAVEIKQFEGKYVELLGVKLEEERKKLQDEWSELETRLSAKCEREKELLKHSYEEQLKAQLEEARLRFEEERKEMVTRLTEQWQKERAQLDEQHRESLEVLLEDEMLTLIREHEKKENKLREEWEIERAQLQKHQEEALLARVAEERSQLYENWEHRSKRLKEEWEREKLQLEEDYEGMLQDRLTEEREKFDSEKEELEQRLQCLMEEQRVELEERHREVVQEVTAKHTEERETLSRLLDKLRDDVTQQRREIEISFIQKIKEVEGRFSDDQESVAERFQADILNLRQKYENELKALSESHVEQKLHLEEELQTALRTTEEQKQMMLQAAEQERERLNQQWAKEQHELESSHKEQMEIQVMQNQQLQTELDGFICAAQTKEIELSRQLNELHNRLEECLMTKDELTAQMAHENELLLNQMVEDFKQKRAELLSHQSDLETKYDELLVICERHVTERIQLLTEHDELKMKIEEFEVLLKQTALDCELERQGLHETISILEERLKDHLCFFKLQERHGGGVGAESSLGIRIEAVKMKLDQLLAEEVQNPDMERSNEIITHIDELLNIKEGNSLSGEDPEMCSPPSRACCGKWSDDKSITDCENCPDSDVLVTCSSEQKLNHLSPNLHVPVEISKFLVEQEGEMIKKTTDAVDMCCGNIRCADDEQSDSANGYYTDGMPEVKRESTENEEQDDQNDVWSECSGHVGEECENGVGTVPQDYRGRDLSPGENPEVYCCSTEIGLCHNDDCSAPRTTPYHENDTEYLHQDENQYSDINFQNFENKKEAFTSMKQCEVHEIDFSLEVFEGVAADEHPTYCENKAVFESCEESKPQHTLALDKEKHKAEQCHVIVVCPSELEEIGDPVDPFPQDFIDVCLTNNSHKRKQEVKLISSDCEYSAAKICDAQAVCARDCLMPLEKYNCEDRHGALIELKTLYNNATKENILLHEKVTLLQQKTDLLENLLAHNSEKVKMDNQVLEENYILKVKMLFLMEQVKELEVKALKMTELQIKYEDCLCENTNLTVQIEELERMVWMLESRINIFYDFQDEKILLLDEGGRMAEENTHLSELGRSGEVLLSVHSESEPSENMKEDFVLQQVAQDQSVNNLEDCCMEFEKQNAGLRRAITKLQGRSQTLNKKTQAHSSEASRLAEENHILRQKINVLKEEDLKEARAQLLQTSEHLKTEKTAAEKLTNKFNKEISELRLRSQHLEDENWRLSEENIKNVANMNKLRQQLAELIKDKNREVFPAEEKTKLAACVSALEAELTKALEDSIQLEERNTQLTQQLSNLREKVVRMDSLESRLSQLLEEQKSTNKETQLLRNQLAKAQERVTALDESLQAANHQSAHLKSDLRALQQERDSLKHEAVVRHKQLQNAFDKNRVMEVALHSSGFQNQSKKLYRDEMSRLLEKEQQLLRQENERLQAEVCSIKGELVQSREKVRHLDTTVLSLKQKKQQSQSCFIKALEQENASLKQELQAQKELNRGCEAQAGHTELESLQLENETLKSQMARMSTQLIESFQVQLAGLLPPSPHRMPRGQHRGEDLDNVQDEREKKMKNMEARMKEIELSLHNVKLLLKEKVAQLKAQLHRNGKADVLINDLYVENTQLLKALEMTEQRQQIAEKKNYLLEEKISSLNKIVRDLNPSSLSPLPYHYKCS